MTTDDMTLSIIRGELPLSSMHETGTQISRKGDSYEVSPQASAVVSPSAADVASGFLSHREERDLREWALFILIAPVVDFSHLEAHEDGDFLIGLLWDAAYGLELDSATVQKLTELVAEETN